MGEFLVAYISNVTGKPISLFLLQLSTVFKKTQGAYQEADLEGAPKTALRVVTLWRIR